MGAGADEVSRAAASFLWARGDSWRREQAAGAQVRTVERGEADMFRKLGH